MLKTDPILMQQYNVASEWSEVTLSTAIDISLIELPKVFTDLYTDRSKLELTADDMAATIPNIQGKVLALLSDIPSWICDMLDCDSLMEFYNKYCARLHFGIVNMQYEVPTIKTFIADGNKYQIPQAVEVNGTSIPLKSINAGQFCDVIECLSQGVAGLPIAMAALCSKNETEAIGRIEDMKGVTMDVAFNVSTNINDAVDYIGSHYKWIFDKSSVNSKLKSAYKRSGLETFGASSWLYEVAESGIGGNYKEVCNMPLYDFIPILSYLRCKNKLYEYSQSKG